MKVKLHISNIYLQPRLQFAPLMSFYLTFDELTPQLKDKITETCRKKPQKTQYNDDPKFINIFRVDKKSKKVHLPLALWSEFLEEFPNSLKQVGDTLSSISIITKNKLFTKETDPKKFRDQTTVFSQACHNLDTTGTTFLDLATGFGKTCIGTHLSAYTGQKTLVLCHLDKVNTQWKSSFETFTTAKVQIVKGSTLDPTADVYVCGIKKAYNMKEKFTNIGTVILDEAHISTTAACTGILLYVEPRFLIGLSATHKRPDGLHSLLYPFFGEEKTFIVRKEVKNFTVYKFNTNIKPEIIYTQYRGNTVPNWVHLKNSLSYNEERRKFIVDLVTKFKDKKILVLIDRVETCKKVMEELTSIGESVTGLFGSVKTHDSEARVIVATTSKAGVGFDQPGLDMLIITSDVKDVAQWEGRIRCSDNIIIDFVDDYHTLEKHWLLRKKWYERRGATIKTYIN